MRAASRSWPPSDATLDQLRQVGDEPADELIGQIHAGHGHRGVHALMASLVADEWVADDDIGVVAQRFLEDARSRYHHEHPVIGAQIAAGQAIFQEHGPEIMLVLGCYSLPAAYAAANGVRVLRQTDYLTNMPERRLVETAQIIVDVMSPGSFEPGGIGIRSAEKTRLMHAAIRHLIVHRPGHPWDAATLGVPINQEDLAATLMTFSYIVIDGLRRMGIRVGAGDAECYLATWREIGLIMGVRPELLPPTMDAAESLTRRIQGRQVRPDEDSRIMTEPLLRVLEDKTLPGVPSALMRLFLPSDVADGIGVPSHPVRDRVIHGVVRGYGAMDRAPVIARLRKTRVVRGLSMDLLEALLEAERGGRRKPFRLPDSLGWYWSDTQRPTRGQRVLHRLASRH